MATTPATPSNAGATTAAQWKDAAVSAKETARQASVAQLQARDALKYSNGKISDANAILNDPNSSSAEKAQAQASLKENTTSKIQAQIALTTATVQRTNAISAAKQAESEAAKNTDPQAASTAAPASTTPNQPATDYTVTPPDSPAATSSTQNVTSANDPSLNTNNSFTEPTRGTTNVVENTTGGGSTTITRGAIVDTPASLAAKEQRNAADQKINAYSLDPNDPTERQFLDSNLQNGVITQQQYDENLTLTADQRQAKVSQAYAESAAASKTIAQTQTMGPDIVTRQENLNTATTTVTDIQPKTADSTVLSGEVTGTNVSTTELGGATYQTVSNADGTTSYTNQVTGTSNTINDSSASDKKTVDETTNGRPLTLDEIIQAKAALRAGGGNNNEGTGTTKKFITDEDGQTTLVAVNGVPVEAAQDKKTVTEFDEAAIAAARQAEYDAIEAKLYADAAISDTNRGLTSTLRNTQTQATQQDYSNFNNKEDWRVRLSLAPSSNYLYKDPDTTIAGILRPLKATNGVIFPYTPAISVAYAAQYDPASLTHTNYKYYTYNSSSVDQITLSCDFTAQDVFEATYLLAVIHFFKSVTKMFYGQDQDPKPGTPPPLCYLSGLGAFQFNNHPLAITNFTYSLPTDVDYIRAGTVQEQPKANQTFNSRLQDAKLQPGAQPAPPQFSGAYLVQEPTYVPTKIQISITAVPIVTRNDISNHFSLKDYAAGVLSKRPSGGGIW